MIGMYMRFDEGQLNKHLIDVLRAVDSQDHSLSCCFFLF